MREINVALCEGRHEIPGAVDGSIFGCELDPTDLVGIRKEAQKRFAELTEDLKVCVITTSDPWPADYGDFQICRYYARLVIYVTGLTVALVEAINVARNLFYGVVLMHYDRESGSYYPQEVI